MKTSKEAIESESGSDRKASKTHTSCPVSVSNYCSTVLIGLVRSFSRVLVVLPWVLVGAKRLEVTGSKKPKLGHFPARFRH